MVGTWLSNKSRKEDLVDLVRYLVETIPNAFVDKSTLQLILLTQIMLETLNESKQNDDVGSCGKKCETDQMCTGVRLDHYYKLGIINM